MLVSAIHQLESAIGIHMSLPPWTSLPPPTLIGFFLCTKPVVMKLLSSSSFLPSHPHTPSPCMALNPFVGSLFGPLIYLFIPAPQPWGLIGHAQLIAVLFQNCFEYVCIFSIPWILHSVCQLLWRVFGVLIVTALPLCINLRKSNIFVIMCKDDLSMTTISHHLLASYFMSFSNISWFSV